MSTRLANSVRSLVRIDNPRFISLIGFTHGMNEFFSIVIPPLLPFVVSDLSIAYADASLLVFVYFAMYSIVQLPVGKLKDRYDPRYLLSGGMVVLSLGIALTAVATDYPLMVLGMAIAGLGGSTYHPTGMALISDVESDTTYGRSMGIHSMLGNLGSVSAPILLTTVAVAADWRTALLTSAAVGFGYAVLLHVAYPRLSPRITVGGRSLAALPADLREAELELRETAASSLRYFRSRTVLVLAVLFFVAGAELRAIQTFTPVFVIDVLGTSSVFGNTMLSVMMVAAGATSMLAGYVVDEVDRTMFTAACFLVATLLVGALVYVPIDRLLLPVVFAVLGISMYSLYPAVNALTAEATSAEESGTLFAVTNTSTALGGAVSPVVLGVVADRLSLQLAFLGTAGITFVGLAVTLVVAFVVWD
ncbi:MFS transporter [Haloplanus sp. GCM10025708]|uniref:MFS transporter n=1 Tax=Haloplanus sp. GCM10025708 TaxID=3252679 RepID=UPI003605C460